MNTFTVSQLRSMSDQEVINLLKKYPQPSAWENKDALRHATTCLQLSQGRNYIATGDRNAFKQIP